MAFRLLSIYHIPDQFLCDLPSLRSPFHQPELTGFCSPLVLSFVSAQATQALETWLILSLLLPRKHAFIHLNPSLKLLLCFILSKRQHFAPEQDLLDAAPRMLCAGVGVQPCPPGAGATPPQLQQEHFPLQH